MSYFDASLSNWSVTSTAAQTTLLGAFQTQLQNSAHLWTSRVTAKGGTITTEYCAMMRITRVEVQYTLTGAVGTALASADMFNRVRVCLFKTPFPIFETPIIPLYDVESFCDLADVAFIYKDTIDVLPSNAFDASDYNSPGMRSRKFTFSVNEIYQWRVAGLPTTDTWVTRQKDIKLAYVSDSSVSPHPSMDFRCRFFFEA